MRRGRGKFINDFSRRNESFINFPLYNRFTFVSDINIHVKKKEA